ncbi:uncharacterized protein TNCV_1536071 [Trichonephila clavipes]|nr:uncharacterized protein TNCV_1536071 [Trichonephila clavipes]
MVLAVNGVEFPIENFKGKTKKDTLVGFGLETRGYRVWIPEDSKVIETSNVRFQKPQQSNSGAVLASPGLKFSDYKVVEGSNVDDKTVCFLYCATLLPSSCGKQNESPRPRMYATVVCRDALSNLYLSLGGLMCGEPTITELFAFIVGDQATLFVTAVDELFLTHTEAAKQPTVSYHPLMNAASKRLEHHHLFQVGEDHQYVTIDNPLPMVDVVPTTETRKTK